MSRCCWGSREDKEISLNRLMSVRSFNEPFHIYRKGFDADRSLPDQRSKHTGLKAMVSLASSRDQWFKGVELYL